MAIECWSEGQFVVVKSETGLTIRNDGPLRAAFRGGPWGLILDPGETWSTATPSIVSQIIELTSNHPKESIVATTQTFYKSDDKPAETLKASDECPQCGKILTIGDWPMCPHTGIGTFAAPAFAKSASLFHESLKEEEKPEPKDDWRIQSSPEKSLFGEIEARKPRLIKLKKT